MDRTARAGERVHVLRPRVGLTPGVTAIPTDHERQDDGDYQEERGLQAEH
jgi:hypothetical protein